jgi:hypothetical protein
VYETGMITHAPLGGISFRPTASSSDSVVEWKTIHVFISSTFNDMHAERDYLVKKVFPQLSEWCEAHKLRLIDIDLRWGVSEADATQNKKVVQVCLDRIDECRPFFLCFLGQRRGWVPSGSDVNQETVMRFPVLKKKEYLGESSVTEMEILHAFIDPLHNGSFVDVNGVSHDGSAVDHAFFFLRDSGYLKDLWEDTRRVYTNESAPDPALADEALLRWRDEIIPNLCKLRNRPLRHYSADWNANATTPEIALSYEVPTTAHKGTDRWAETFSQWKARWKAAGVTVGDDGVIADEELAKAKRYNQVLTQGRLGTFRCEEKPLSDVIIDELKKAIALRYPENMNMSETLTPLQKELDQQAQFMRIASEGFILRTGDFDRLNEYINDKDNRPFAVIAKAGMGKTGFLANWITVHQLRLDEKICYRFIGASDETVNANRMLRSMLSELQLMSRINSEIPKDNTELKKALPH